MRQDPELRLPPPGQGFPLFPGREEELVNIQNGDGDGEVKNYSKKRKPGRRSKHNKQKGNVNIKLIHSNIDGYISKKESVNEIVEREKPEVMTLNDTNLKGKLKVKVPNYFSYDKRRTNI